MRLLETTLWVAALLLLVATLLLLVATRLLLVAAVLLLATVRLLVSSLLAAVTLLRQGPNNRCQHIPGSTCNSLCPVSHLRPFVEVE